ncbi:MAG TPA: T9SS type A sorting domain-containing protein [Draconibacterium sp.]|nr:T9SS type A sorting domain-containing protein [Draconibacterium sp.]
MKLVILLGILISSLSIAAQDFYSSGDCKADFTFAVNPDIQTLLPATAINFFDNSVGDIKEWYWDFGDSITSNEQNPLYIFNHPMNGPTVKISPYKKITLTIVTSDGCKSSSSQTINIIDGTISEQNQNCQAIFKFYESKRDTLAGITTFTFNNFSEGENLSYFWQFGNGTTSTEKEPVVKFDFKQKEYQVCLTVTGIDSCISIMCDAVYMETPINWDSVYIDPVEPRCFAGFAYNMKDILMGPLPSMLVEFNYKSYPEAKEWYWDFGDGITSTEPNPVHTFIQTNQPDSIFGDSVYYVYPNPYRTVCLTILTEDSCEVSYCENIPVFVTEPQPDTFRCNAYYKYYQPDDIVTIPEVVPIQLVEVAEGDIISREWVFEDGSVNIEKDPLVMFSIFQPEHKVNLTVMFADSCVITYYGIVYLNPVTIDTTVVNPACPYNIKVDGGFPTTVSSCAGWASALVYLGEELVEPAFIRWSTGDSLAKVSGLCPTQTYSVEAIMPDGCNVSTKFVLNADGIITPVTVYNWWLMGEKENMYVQSDAPVGMKVEWRLCDGTVVEADSIPLDAINCGGNESNMIIKDLQGNVVYSENISLKTTAIGIRNLNVGTTVKLWPNPANDKLNIRYSGKFLPEMTVEICDMTGKSISSEVFRNISDNQEIGLNTESLKTGIYICRVSAAGKTIDSKKFSRN